MKRNTLLVLAALLTLAGCEKREVFEDRRITVEVVGKRLSSKSNSRVHLRDVKTGAMYEVRPGCYRAVVDRIPQGSLWDVTERTYVYRESQRYYVDVIGTHAMCGSGY